MKDQLVQLTTESEDLKRLDFIQVVLGDLGKEVEVETRQCDLSALKNHIEGFQHSAKSIRFSSELAGGAYFATEHQKTAESMVHLQTDALILAEGKYWQRLYGVNALIDLIQIAVGRIDNTSIGIVAGSVPFVRVALYSLSKLGFSKLQLLATDLKVAEEIREHFLKRNFGLNLEIVPSEDITLHSSSASILINTVRENENPELIEDLCYFNFLKPNGLVVNLYPELENNPLIREAKDVNMQVITGPMLQARIDYLWLKDLYPNLSWEWPQYLASWQAHLKQLAT